MKRFGWFSISIAALTVVLLVAMLSPARTDVKVSSSSDILSIQAHVALAAQTGGTNGVGEPLPQQTEAIFSKGGPPVISVAYNFNAILDTDDVLTIDNVELPNVHCTKAKVKEKVKAKVKGGVTEYDATALRNDIQSHYEIWVLLSEFTADDPVRNGVLLDNERIEKVTSKDYLVITLAYFDIHIYSLEPLRFVTRINGLDAGPIIGEWWL